MFQAWEQKGECYTADGKARIGRRWYRCDTCGINAHPANGRGGLMVGSLLCVVCAQKCHRGHQVAQVPNPLLGIVFTCACGPTCKARPQAPPPQPQGRGSSDDRKFWNDNLDKFATLAKVHCWNGMDARKAQLLSVLQGSRVDSKSRLGAFAATLGYDKGTVGHGVNIAIGLLYLMYGDQYQEEIGTVFNSLATKAFYSRPVTDKVANQAVAHMEYEYWSGVQNQNPASEGAKMALKYSVEERMKLQEALAKEEMADAVLTALLST